MKPGRVTLLALAAAIALAPHALGQGDYDEDPAFFDENPYREAEQEEFLPEPDEPGFDDSPQDGDASAGGGADDEDAPPAANASRGTPGFAPLAVLAAVGLAALALAPRRG